MKSPTPREEPVLALVLDESRKLQTLSTQAQGCNELDGLVVDLRAAIRGRPGEGVRERKAEVANVAIRLAALAVRFVLDLRLDRYLDPSLPEDSPLRKLGLEESFPAAPDHLSPTCSNAEVLARPWRSSAPVPEGCTPIELDRFPVEFEGRHFIASGRLMAREVAPAGGDRTPLVLRRSGSVPTVDRFGRVAIEKNGAVAYAMPGFALEKALKAGWIRIPEPPQGD